ncbi:FADR318Wp [Eremothecium gossypii FDAG1]|nr:FADR318Wp [Eremothecium gossypii FDAG1]
MPASRVGIASLPDEVKLELLFHAPELRYLSREWYRLHDVVCALKCARLADHKLLTRCLKGFSSYSKACLEELEPLRLLCREGIAQTAGDRSESIEERMTGAWYWAYYMEFVYPLVILQSLSFEQNRLPLKPVEVLLCNSKSRELSLWVHLVQRTPGLRPTIYLNVTAFDCRDDDERGDEREGASRKVLQELQIKYTLEDFVAERMTQPGKYCLKLPPLQLSCPGHGVLLRAECSIRGTGCEQLIPLALDFAPYQIHRPWFMFKTYREWYNLCLRNRRTGEFIMDVFDIYPECPITSREFLFRFLDCEVRNSHLDWTTPYLGERDSPSQPLAPLQNSPYAEIQPRAQLWWT